MRGTSHPFVESDLAVLGERGIPLAEARRQIDLLNAPPRFVALDRCCRVGDGIVSIADSERDELLALHDRAASDGRIVKFVPASGAATRMFRDLERLRGRAGGVGPEDLAEGSGAGFFSALDAFAFRGALGEELSRRDLDLDALRANGNLRPVLEALLAPDGLDYASLPKGLLLFHDAEEGPRTPFEEHLVEAAGYARDGGVARLHFTVSPEHREKFVSMLESAGPTWEARLGVRFEVGFSTQHASTDTLAVDLEGRPFRDDDGRLVFRPGGHGALLHNLNALRGDLVFVKNIDNVVPDDRKGPTLLWKRLLAGCLVRLQDRIHGMVRELRSGSPAAERLVEMLAFAEGALHLAAPEASDAGSLGRWLLEVLDRPIRVCGVVRNAGEPGGGPFWVRPRPGAGPLQIVEGAQVDPRDEEQQEIFRAATHFNPVDLVCGLRNASGEPFDLAEYVDPDAVIVTRKSFLGRDLKALELPGLWNGGMSRWHTVFVEVPADTFAPVKTVNDLLRPEHRRGDRGRATNERLD